MTKESWEGGKWFIVNVVLEENFVDTMGGQKDKPVGHGSNQVSTISGGKNAETEGFLHWTCHEKTGLTGKGDTAGKEEDQIWDQLAP